MRFKDLFVHWVEACIVFIHLPGTTTVTPGTNRQRRGIQPQSMDGKKSHRSRIRGPEYFGREVYLSDVILMIAFEVQGFVSAWVEAYTLPGTTVTSGTNRQRRGRQPKSWDV